MHDVCLKFGKSLRVDGNVGNVYFRLNGRRMQNTEPVRDAISFGYNRETTLRTRTLNCAMLIDTFQR